MYGGANPKNSRRSGVSPVTNSTSTSPARTASRAPGQSGLCTTAKSVPMSLSNSALYAAARPSSSPSALLNSNGGHAGSYDMRIGLSASHARSSSVRSMDGARGTSGGSVAQPRAKRACFASIPTHAGEPSDDFMTRSSPSLHTTACARTRSCCLSGGSYAACASASPARTGAAAATAAAATSSAAKGAADMRAPLRADIERAPISSLFNFVSTPAGAAGGPDIALTGRSHAQAARPAPTAWGAPCRLVAIRRPMVRGRPSPRVGRLAAWRGGQRPFCAIDLRAKARSRACTPALPPGAAVPHRTLPFLRQRGRGNRMWLDMGRGSSPRWEAGQV